MSFESAELSTRTARAFAESLAERGYLRAPRAADLAPGHYRARRLHPGRVIVEWIDWRARVQPRRPIEPERARAELKARRARAPREPRAPRAEWSPEHPIGSRVRFVDGPSAGLCGEVLMVPGAPSKASEDRTGYRIRIDGRPRSRERACAEWLEGVSMNWPEGDGAFLVPEE